MGKKAKPGTRPDTKALKPPKVECCVSKVRCNRCPLRMLKEGTLPAPYAVKKRNLVVVDAKGRTKKVKKSSLKKTWAA